MTTLRCLRCLRCAQDAQDYPITIRAIPDRGLDSAHASVTFAGSVRANGNNLLAYDSRGELIGIHYLQGTGMFLELERP